MRGYKHLSRTKLYLGNIVNSLAPGALLPLLGYFRFLPCFADHTGSGRVSKGEPIFGEMELVKTELLARYTSFRTIYQSLK